MSQAELARYLGVSQEMVSMVEEGEKAFPKMWLSKLAGISERKPSREKE